MSNLFSIHNHTDASNIRLRDSINGVEKLIDNAVKLGLEGVCITDHELLGNALKAIQYANNEKKSGRIPKDFKIGAGNEIYLIDWQHMNERLNSGEKVTFPHFVLLAKNSNGFQALKELSKHAWKNSFTYKGIERVPTYKEKFEEVLKKYKGDVIGSTACIGGELPQLILNYENEKTDENKLKIHNFIKWLKNLFEDDIYFELQPSNNEEQIFVNKMLLKLGEAYGVKTIVTTDSHYYTKEDFYNHKIYLSASNGDRETELFYATTYLMNKEYLKQYFEEEVLEKLINNTNEIKNKIEEFDPHKEIQIPIAKIPEFSLPNTFEKFYNKYEYIKKYANSAYKIDRYYLFLIIEGMKKRNQDLNDTNLSRIDLELNELYHITKKLKQPMSSYFVLTKDIIDIMWEFSIVGVARGSAACYYTNYLLDIVQINPLEHGLPHWRFLSKERSGLPDIDIDAESAKRNQIIEAVKQRYGEDYVINVGTYTTEGPASACLTACRGYGVNYIDARNITNLLPKDKTVNWPLKDVFYGNEKKGRKPSLEFIKSVEKYEGLKEAMLSIEGLISGRSQHASAVIIYPNKYTEYNTIMKTTSGGEVTQFDADDTEYMGGLKLDFLSLSGLDKIRCTMDLLLKHGKIKSQGNLRKTFNKYFHPDVLEMKDKKMYDLLYTGEVINAFQFETVKNIAA